RQPTASHPRGLLVLDPYSRATVVEHFTGGGHYLTNAVTEIVLGEGARLDYCLVVSEGEESFHVGRVRVEHGPGSHFNASTVTFGGALCRTEIHDRLGAEGAGCVLNGLYLGGGRQHVDNLTRVEHVSARCTSRELYKGILDGRATGVFSGQLRVEEDARHSDATQLNQNLVLSGAATVDTLPHLDLLADDVRCAHAAEVEPLDEDRLFYLRSRGVPEGEARALLTRAFAGEVLEHIQPAAWRDQVRAKVEAVLPGGSAWSPST
ncbi:MAG TPA: SufD family Fe-S cluster assembly protein, partial [Myxococcaceae bacterium]|nr:SufD family Fe-S cluster assembly protein [Myxococcaceae bacterium]